MEICYQNVRGLRTKLNLFYSSIESSGSDLYAITESGCNKSIVDAELVPAGYQILRCDRADGRKQGGALIIASPRFELRPMKLPDNIDVNKHAFEVIAASVYQRYRFLLLLCTAYIPPNAPEEEYLVLFKIIEHFSLKYKECLVVGDFNLNSCNNNVLYEYFLTFCEFVQSNKIGNCDNC